MANFKTHFKYGLITSSISTVLLSANGFFTNPFVASSAFILGTIASISPDFDSATSTPGDFLFNCLGILLPLGIVMYFVDPVQLKPEHWITYMVVGYFIVRYPIRRIFNKLTVHRGLFHSTPAIVLCGQIAFFIFAHLPMSERVCMGIMAMIGYATHLILDECYSVDWQDNQITFKRSLGTALDMGKLNLSTFFLYTVIITLAYFQWRIFYV